MNRWSQVSFYIVTAGLMLSGCGGGTTGSGNTSNGITSSVSTDLMGGTIQSKALNLSGMVTTFVGSHSSSGSTDGMGSAASFKGLTGITTDGTNLYVVEAGNNAIRKIAISTGAVTTIAGSAGASGSEDGMGLAARFNSPSGITTDGTNLYVTEAENHTVRQIVIATGAVTTIAGSAGASGTADGVGAAARFDTPSGITTDGTNLYVADTFNAAIRKVVIATVAVTTIAGSAVSFGVADGTGTAAKFGLPMGITTDKTNLYVADLLNSNIRRIVIATGAVSTVAGSAGSTGLVDGPGSAARFFFPTGITTDGTNLYVAEPNNNAIRRIVIAAGAVTTVTSSAGLSDTPAKAASLATSAAGTANSLTDVIPGVTLVPVAGTSGAASVPVTAPTMTVGTTNTTATITISIAAITTDGTSLYISSGGFVDKMR